MNGDRPLVILTRKWPNQVESELSKHFNVELNPEDRSFTQEEWLRAMERADAICPTVTDTIDASLISHPGKTVKIIANYGAGVEHIDIESARRGGIIVTNTPEVLTEATAEITIALMLMISRRAVEGEKLVRANRWHGWGITEMLSTSVTGKTLGLIGMGRIATRVAEIAGHGFNMNIQYFSRSQVSLDRISDLDVKRGSLDEILSTSDFVSIHCPVTKDTVRLIDSAALDLMQSHAFLINTARGAIVDEDALASALELGLIAGAGLDVYQNEPTINPRLLVLDNTVLLPHMGSGTRETREAMGMKVVENLRAFFAGHNPPDQV